jgi:hypothetical protein
MTVDDPDLRLLCHPPICWAATLHVAAKQAAAAAAAAVLHITTYAARAAACLEAVALVWGPGNLVLEKEFPRIESPSAIISRLDAMTARKGHSSISPLTHLDRPRQEGGLGQGASPL